MGTQRLPVAAMGALAALLASITFGQESVDLGEVHRIKTEAFENSKVMDHLFYLNDVYGPRLTNSTGFFAAVAWAVKTLGEWGILAHVEKWNYGRGWNYTHFEAHLLEPQYASLIGFPLVSVRSGIAATAAPSSAASARARGILKCPLYPRRCFDAGTLQPGCPAGGKQNTG